jgi:predicted nucleic acid-binding protein
MNFDADVIIYAAVGGHQLGRRVRALFADEPPRDAAGPTRIGSVLLVPELLTKTTRDGADDELSSLAALLGRLELLPTDLATAALAASLGLSTACTRRMPCIWPPPSVLAPTGSSPTTKGTSRVPSPR